MTSISAASAVNPIVNQVANAQAGSVEGEAALLMLKKSLDIQAGSAVQLTESLPQPTLANMGSVGTQVNTYA